MVAESCRNKNYIGIVYGELLCSLNRQCLRQLIPINLPICYKKLRPRCDSSWFCGSLKIKRGRWKHWQSNQLEDASCNLCDRTTLHIINLDTITHHILVEVPFAYNFYHWNNLVESFSLLITYFVLINRKEVEMWIRCHSFILLHFCCC